MLGREDLIARLDDEDVSRRLVITPLLDRDQVSPASVDLRLGTEFIETRRPHFLGHGQPAAAEMAAEPPELRFAIPVGSSILLHPGEFLLGATLEFLSLPNDLGGQILARSTWGRMGLVVATAVMVQPGFRGCLTLELANEGAVPLPLIPGDRIAQLVLWRTGTPVEEHYGTKASSFSDRLGPASAVLDQGSEERLRLQRLGERLAGHTWHEAEG